MRRTDAMDRLREPGMWDVVVIGGGATGLGAAVDAAARGFRTLLLEAHDYAKGTSSRSTKLVHGGVRYLQQGNVKLVREALHERGLLRRNAPHLVHDLPFVVPAYTWWSQPFYGAGLMLYDVLAGSLGIGSTKLIGKAEVLRRAPTLEPDGLRGGVVYYDGQFDDARLAIALLRTFEDQGGTALNYAPVTGLIKDGARVAGVRVRDAERGAEFEARARVVVNATGVYVDQVRQMDDPQARAMLSPSQGVHLVLPRHFLPTEHAVMIPRTDDGRVLFAVPWHDRVILGTTDTPIKDTPLEPRPLEAEIEFLMTHAARYLAHDPQPDDVCSVYVGLRPLVKGTGNRATQAISRDHTLVVAPSGLITITGGKWTTYRRMGADTVDKAVQVASLPQRPSVTETLHLRGATTRADGALAIYGSDADAVQQVIDEQPGWNALLHPDLPYFVGEAAWAARYEQARSVEDVLARRTRALLLDARASSEAAPAVAAVLAQELGHDAAWVADQIEQFQQLARGYTLQPELTSA